jgi:hypothetical protein
MVQTMASKDQRRAGFIQQFVVNVLAMQLLLGKFPGITQLLTSRRYQIRTENALGLGEIRFVTTASCVLSFHSSNNLILTAIRVSGILASIEFWILMLYALSWVRSSCGLRVYSAIDAPYADVVWKPTGVT